MKILKLLFVVAILSFMFISSSILQAAEDTAPAMVDSSKDLKKQPEVAQVPTNKDTVSTPEPQKKSFIRKIMFWKKDNSSEMDQSNDTNEDSILEEDIDPRLKKERSKPIEVRIRDKYGIKVDALKIFESNLKVTNKDEINKDTEFVAPLDDTEREMFSEEFYDRKAPVIMAHLDLKQSVDSYKKMYFPNFKEVARIKVIYEDISENEIKGYGAYLGVNLIIVKKIFEPTIGKFVYDIMFLNGDTENKNIYWFRNISEAEPLDKTLKALKIKNLNDYMNLITYKVLNPNRKISQKIYKNFDTKKETDSKAEKDSKEATSSQNGMQPENTNNLVTVPVDNTKTIDKDSSDTSMFLLNDLTEEELYEIQKELITFRVNRVVGLWEDINSGEVIEIRAMPKKGKNNEVTYSAYVLLGSDLDAVSTNESNFNSVNNTETIAASDLSNDNTNVDKIARTTTSNDNGLTSSILDGNSEDTQDALPQDENTLPVQESDMNVNKSLSWLSTDLKMQFSSVSGSGFFLDKEKMLEKAIVYFHPAKGLIVVALPNKEYRYYKPIIPDLYPALEEELYNNVNIKETNVDQDKTTRYSEELDSVSGTTNYFLYPGVTLGAVAAFLLIFM